MSLLTVFARIKVLFHVTKRPEQRLTEMSEHLRKDIGLNHGYCDVRAKGHEPKREDIVTCGVLTRGP